jgi:hypothetical protein
MTLDACCASDMLLSNPFVLLMPADERAPFGNNFH